MAGRALSDFGVAGAAGDPGLVKFGAVGIVGMTDAQGRIDRILDIQGGRRLARQLRAMATREGRTASGAVEDESKDIATAPIKGSI